MMSGTARAVVFVDHINKPANGDWRQTAQLLDVSR
jgi:hypothetical protein